jgi:hypothetical protein
MNRLFTLITICTISFVACKTDNAESLYPNKVACDTTNVKYGATVQPIIQTNCLNQGCHTSGNPSGGYTFETYTDFTVTVTGGTLLNAIHYRTGGTRNMPPTGQLSACDIDKIEAWIKRGYPNN